MANKVKMLLTAAVLAGVMGQGAQSQTYNCAVKTFGRNDGISPIMIFTINPNSDKMLVHDVHSLAMKRPPWGGKIRKRTDKRIDFSWTIKAMGTANGSPMTVIGDYSAAFILTSGKIFINAAFRGADNRLDGTGRCQIKK
ncbi:MAG: hypothetical protein ACRBBU_00860 [Pseudooceanicola sp.]